MSYSCFDDACPARDPDRAYVAVTTSRGTREITVMRSGKVFSIEGGARERPGPVAPDFTSPPVARPMFDGAPFAIARRRPLPLGGDETVSMGGPCDEAARTCFLHGGLSGSPVELVTRSHGTEGEPVAEILRYTGTGGILVYDFFDAHWVRYNAGLRIAGGDYVFGAGGRTSHPRPVR